MNVQTWKIIPYGLSGLHIGKQGMAQERSSIIYHSDSLFSALFQTLAAVSDKIHFDELLNEFNSGDPPFSITSAYPFAGDIRFFPMPLNVRFAENPQDKTNALKEKSSKEFLLYLKKFFANYWGITLNFLKILSLLSSLKAVCLCLRLNYKIYLSIFEKMEEEFLRIRKNMLV